MLIVNAQVHICGADTPERARPAGGHGRAHDLDRVMGGAPCKWLGRRELT